MRDHQQSGRAAASSEAPAQAQTAGRSTLTEQLGTDVEDPVPQWEPIDPHEVMAHAASHEKPFYAATDQYNRKQKRGRPKAGDVKLTKDLPRYEIKSGTATVSHDSVKTGTDVTINVAHVRKLVIGGESADCVLTRTVDGGAAWARLADLPGNHAAIRHATEKLAAKYAPKSPGNHKGVPHVFKSPGPSDSGYALTGNLGSQSKSNYDHYLERPGGTYNVCLNLPQPGTPPVQVDVAFAGDHFYVIETKEVALYKKGSSHEAKRVHWAFGCVGKRDAHGHETPDRARRGWVPLADLAKG